jgi:hypothetical protein
LFDRLAPWEDQLPVTGASSLSPVSHYLGGLAAVLHRDDEAQQFFSRSAELSRRIGAKFFAARTDLLWGGLLARRGAPADGGRARALLTSAHAVAAASGYGNVERRAAAALGSLGG